MYKVSFDEESFDHDEDWNDDSEFDGFDEDEDDDEDGSDWN